MRVELHLAVQGDEALFTSPAPEVFDRPVRADYLTPFLACPRHHMVCAVSGSALVGYVAAQHALHLSRPAQLWISDIRITPLMQRQGIGRRLLRRMLDHGAVLDCCEARMLAETTQAAGFCAALGGRAGVHTPWVFTFPIENSHPMR